MAALASLSELGVYFILLYISRTCLSQNTTTPVPNNTTDNATQTVPTTTPIVTTTPVVTTSTTTLAPNVPGTLLPTDKDFSLCPCDLTGLGCDLNCCCDPDCTDNDKLVFSECLRDSYRLDDKLCFDRDVIFIENGPEYSNTTDNLFCIYFDNEEERNYYKNPSLIKTEAKFQEYVEDYGKFSFQSMPIPSLTAGIADYYKSGDPLFIVFSSQAASYLALPTAISTSPYCTDGNPAAYLVDQTVSCSRRVNLPTDCLTFSAFKASTFYQNMRLVRDPFLLQAFNSTTTMTDEVLGTVDLSGVTELYNNSFTLDFVLDPNATLTCFTAAGVQKPTCSLTSQPTWDAASTTCQNVVSKVEYRFVTEGTFGVQNVYVNFVLRDINSNFLTQSFQTTFNTKTDSSNVVPRSGNPGYQVGQPIIAGVLNQTTVAGNTEQEILFEESRGQQLALVKPSGTGNCGTTSGEREPVVFGQNMRTGCFIEVQQTANVCADLQNQIFSVLEGSNVPTHVAMFGDSSPTKIGDWVEILYQNKPNTPATTTECDLSLGMDIQIIYANVGALPNPQPKIIGVSFVYDIRQIVEYKCSGPFCQPGSGALTQRVEISSSVTFIDASKSPQEVESEYPTFAVRLPYDFFYPFLNAGSLKDTGANCIILCLLVIYCSIF